MPSFTAQVILALWKNISDQRSHFVCVHVPLALGPNHVIRIEAHDWLIFFLGAVCFRAYFRTWRLFWPSSVEELRSKGAIYIHIIDKMQRSTRMQRELSILTNEPPPGILCWMVDDQIDKLQAGFEMNSALQL